MLDLVLGFVAVAAHQLVKDILAHVHLKEILCITQKFIRIRISCSQHKFGVP